MDADANSRVPEHCVEWGSGLEMAVLTGDSGSTQMRLVLLSSLSADGLRNQPVCNYGLNDVVAFLNRFSLA